MKLFILLSLLVTNMAHAEIGKILKIVGTDAYLMRGSEKISLAPDLALELNDDIQTESSFVLIHLYPGTQMSLSKKSQIKLTDYNVSEANNIEKTWSVVSFIRGILRAKVDRDTDQEVEQKFEAPGVAFGIRGTEFEIAIEENEDVDLDVFEGQVEVSSPYIQSFVPEYVKAKEGFRFERARKAFAKRKFAPKFKDHPGFEDKKKLLKKWREKRLKNMKQKVRAGKLKKARENRKRN